jgi:hypothetical protein
MVAADGRLRPFPASAGVRPGIYAGLAAPPEEFALSERLSARFTGLLSSYGQEPRKRG